MFSFTVNIFELLGLALIVGFWAASFWENNTRDDELGAVPGFFARWFLQIILSLLVIYLIFT